MNTRWILVILLTVMMIALIWRNEMSDMADPLECPSKGCWMAEFHQVLWQEVRCGEVGSRT